MTNDDAESESLPYPDWIAGLQPGKETAIDVHTAWVKDAFDAVAQRTTPSFVANLPPFQAPGAPPHTEWQPAYTLSGARRVDAQTQEWKSLAGNLLLWAWVYLASHDADIATQFGTSDRLIDNSGFLLMEEGFDFLNDMLARLDQFDANRVKNEASLLWDGLANGTETFEIGGIVFLFATNAAVTEIDVGPNTWLRRVDRGQWGKERFDRAGDLPPTVWALTRRVTIPYSPHEFRDRSADRSAQELLLRRGLLAIRLVKPTFGYVLGSIYRIGLVGHREQLDRGYFAERFWRAWDGKKGVLRNGEIQRLTAIGAAVRPHIPDPTNEDEVIKSELLDLAIERFNLSFDRPGWQDKVVDLAIVFEALLARTGEEITHKAAVRAALLLGTGRDESERIYRTVKQFYDLRSAIVHGLSAKQRTTATRKTIAAWQGQKAIPTEPERQGPAAANVGAELVAAALRAFLMLSANGEDIFDSKSNKSTKFLEQVDLSALNQRERQRVRVLAGVVSARTRKKA